MQRPRWLLASDCQTTSGKEYKLACEIPSSYPNSPPDLLLWSPQDARDYSGRELRSIPANRTMHTLGSKNNYTKLCHVRPENWSVQDTLYKVLVKGVLWCHALDIHLRTGKHLDMLLSENPVTSRV
jgi:hypothetical protein